MASQGIQLPISLQISNLQDIANQLKQFANKNVLADSFGGKKIDSELSKILSRLEQISAKSKTAFTTQSDFTSVQKEIDQVELGLNKIQGTIRGLDFSDLKIPTEFAGQIEALQGRIRELNNSLTVFKGTQKEKLINNTDFMADLQKADPRSAAKMLEKGYDELYQAINTGMDRVNGTLALKTAEYKRQQEIITQNSKGKNSLTQWGALSFIQDAFKTLPNDDRQRNAAQNWIAEFMKEAENGKEFASFNKGAIGMNGFLKSIRDKFSFSDSEMAEMKARIREQVQALRDAGEKEATAATVVQSMGHNESLAKRILFGDKANDLELSAKQYATQVRDAQKILEEKTQLTERSEAYARVKVAFDIPNQEIKQKSEEIAAALKVPEEALRGFEASILSAATSSPQLAALFQSATQEISALTSRVEEGKSKLESIDNTIGKMQGISNFINRYVGIYAIVRKVTQAVRNAMSNIKDLDKAITAIAVVTNMSQEDLWGKIGEYTAMAQQYGVATKDVYTVSQIFYQQGLQTSQVMSMTTESLKMAKIAGIDYSTAANAMTVAVRAFKLEMTEAQSVTDTYSALAAKFAVSSSEIANAMEKTASSAASVGMSLQSTSAFISVMEQTTRESAQNIGSALKSIISRYGEMKASPEKLLNVEGEEVAFNKVDTALSSIGISIKDASGQFRDFDDVIMELAKRWDSLDNNTQRYIATIMAGNRQQSRFIALVSNYDELNRAMQTANNAENASIVQVAKTMDSLESKANQVKNAFSQLYLDLHIEEGLKGAYDWITRILKTIGKLGTLKGVLPTLANIIGFGTGTKGLVKMGIDAMQAQKSKYQVETTQAQQDIERIRAKASEDIVAKYRIEADLTQLEASKGILQSEIATTEANQTTAMTALQTKYGISTAELNRMHDEGTLKDDTKLSTYVGLATNGDAAKGKELTQLLQSFEASATELDKLNAALKNLQTTIEALNASKKDEADSSQGTSNANRDLANSAHDAAEGNRNAAGGANDNAGAQSDAAAGAQNNAEAQRGAAAGALGAANGSQIQGQSSYDAAGGNKDLGQSAREAAGELRNIKSDKKSSSSSTSNLGKIMTGVSLTSSLARMLGTFVVAQGASHQDKSTDINETSKILTGLGNGLSGLGTGAQMGMMAGNLAGHPIIGAIIGGIGGFLISGLGAILDGATMTLEEQLALEKEEAKEAADTALKQSAKATDMSSQLENLKTLKEHMYDSADSMTAYKDAMNTLASQYPQLISAYDSAGNAIIDLQDAEQTLANVRAQASTAAREAAVKEAKTRKTQIEILDNFDKIMGDALSGQKSLQINNKNMGVTEKSTAFVLQSATGTVGKNGVYEYAITGDRSVSITGSHGYDSTQNTQAGSDFLRIFEILRDSNYITGNDEVDAALAYYREHKDEHLSTENFKLIGNYIKNSGYLNDGGVYHGTRVQSKFIIPGSGIQIDLNNAENLRKFIDIDTEAPTETYDYNKTELIAKMDKFLEENGEALGIEQKTAAEYFGFENGEQLDLSTIQEYWRKLQAIGANYNKQAKILDKQVTRAYAQEEIDLQLPYTNFSADKESKISTSKIFASMITQGLEAAAKSAGFDSAADWSTSKDKAAFIAKKQELAEKLFTWIGTISDSELDAFIAASNESDQYLSADEIISKYHITDSELQEALIKQFAESNQVNKDRIIKAIYGDKYTGGLNAQLKGLSKLSSFRYNGSQLEESNAALDIAQMFESNEIISKYADYFTNQLISINKLAEDGYTQLAGTRLASLKNVADILSSIENSQMQNDLFGVITNINFSDFNSIQTGLKSLETYAEQNTIDLKGNNQVAQLYQALTDAAGKLIFNVNTLAEELTTQIINASKDIDSILTANKSGMSLDKALESFNQLSSQFPKLGSFDEIFQYDAVLGSYIYTEKGLNAAIQAKEQEMATQVAQLEDTAKIYTEQITSAGEDGNYTTTRWISEGKDKKAFKDTESLNRAMKSNGIVLETDDEKVKLAYEQLAGKYIESTKEEDRTWEGFWAFIEEQAKSVAEQRDAALLIQKQWQANKKNQYYSAIDWSKLASDTDITGSADILMKSLAAELHMYDTEKQEWAENIAEDARNWQGVLSTYLASVYGKAIYDESDPEKVIGYTMEGATQENIFKYNEAWATAFGNIAKSNSEQATTAINELLGGAGTQLSETSRALMRNAGLANNIDSNGCIEAGTNVLESAIALYNSVKSSFQTVAEANASYAAIINERFKGANTLVSTLASGASLDSAGLENFFNTFNLTLSDFYDAETNNWKNGLSEYFSTDIFGKTTIKNWNGFIESLDLKQWVLSSLTSSFAYQNAYSSYVDGLIQLDTQFQDLIKKSYDNAFNSITLFKQLNVSQLSEGAQAALTANGAATITDGVLTVTNALEYARNAEAYFAQLSSLSAKDLYDETGGWSTADLAKNWKAVQTVLTQSQDSWTGIGKSLVSVTTDQLSTLIEKGGLKISDIGEGKLFEKVGDHYIMTLENYALELAKSMAHNGEINEEAYNKAFNEATQAIFDNISNLDWTKVFDGTVTNADLDTFRSSLKDNLVALGLTYSDYVNEATGELDVSALLTALAPLDQALVDHIEQTVAEIQNNILSSITSASDYVYQGTNSISDMQKFVDEYNKVVGTSFSIGDLFTYDTNLDQFTLSSANLKTYISKQKEALAKLGMSGEAIEEYIKDQTETLLQQNMDVTSILDGTSTPEQQKAIFSLNTIIDDYLNLGNKIYSSQTQEMQREIAELEAQEAMTTSAEEASKYQRQIEALQAQIKGLTSEQIVSILYAGGEEAVNILKQLKGDNITADEVSAVYNAGINRINAAMEALEQGEGAILQGMAAEIAKVSDGITTQTLPDGSVVITSVTSMTDAYSRLYAQMSQESAKTTASLNSLYAKFLTSIDQSEADAIATLNDAMGMSYEALGELLTKYNKSLETAIKNSSDWGIRSLGNGQVQIFDFDAFAKEMEWSPDSMAYKEARKSYNDAMIEFDRKFGENLFNEVKSLSEGKVGDKIDLTYLSDSMGGLLNELIKDTGIELSNGIATIGEKAKIPQLITRIAQSAAKANMLLPEQLAELSDAVNSYFDNIVNLIKNGISGNLSNVDAQHLQSWADQFNIDLNFTRTTEGLKLSTEEALKLYNELKKVDALKAQLVFDELTQSLQESNENYTTMAATLGRIAELRKLKDTADPTKREQYEAELAIAEQIAQVRATTEDSSMNFMSNKIPAAQNNPLNYFQNWATAWQTLQKSKKTNTIDYTAFYNIVTEMGNLAEKSGAITVGAGTVLNNSKDAAKLIEAAAQCLKVDAQGALSVDLSNLAQLGFNFEAAGADMASGVEKGIHEMAESQIEMLDGLIQMLELIVAMENLGDITGGDNTIDIGDIFPKFNENDFTITDQNIRGWMEGLLKIEDESSDLYQALDNIIVNSKSLRQLMKEGLAGSLNKEDATALSGILNSFWQMLQSGDFNEDDLYNSIAQIAKSAGLGEDTVIKLKDSTLIISGGHITQIDWKDADTAKVLEQWKEEQQSDEDGLINAIAQYNEGKKIPPTQLTYVLQVQKKLTIDEDKNVSVNINGQTKNLGQIEGDALTNVQNWVSLLDLTGMDLPTDREIDLTTEAASLTLKTEVDAGLKMEVSYDSENGLQYTYEGHSASSPEELARQLIQYSPSVFGNMTEAEVLWKFGIRAKVQAKVTVGEKEVSLKTDSDTRKNIIDALDNTDWLSKVGKEVGKDGNLTFPLGDAKITVPGAEVTAEDGVTVDTTKLEAYIREQLLGMDLGLAETIAEGVKKAFSEVDDSKVTETKDKATEAQEAINNLNNAIKNVLGIKIEKEDAVSNIKEIDDRIKALSPQEVKIEIPRPSVDPIRQAIAELGTPTVNVRLNPVGGSTKGGNFITSTLTGLFSGLTGNGPARGTIGLANAKGTLMGELGPELVVSGGRYFVVGQSGPEMVDLEDDAIVFNHIQTKSLLEKGTSPSRGKAITNDYTAASYAKGNINGGPAMASASAALNALKQLRAQWRSLLALSAKDLAGKGGGGGGGGDPKPFIKQLERWYNWLQEIARLEKEINYEEAKRSKYATDFNRRGGDYVRSQEQTLKHLQSQVAIQKNLNKEQEKYFKDRIAQVNANNGPFTSLYTIDDNGQLKYKPGQFEWLSNLQGTDETGKPRYTAEEQYNAIIAKNPEFAKYMEYDSSGNPIKKEGNDWYATALQAFWDKIDMDRDEFQGLFDSIEEGKAEVEKLEQERNEILKEMEDNQIAVEQKVLKAVEESRQREIDELQKQRDAIEKGNQALIEGLNNQLQKEQEMYSQQQETDELSKLQRQLAILQRSGGSAASIADLQDQIADKQQSMYFEAQQQQIDALQEASDNELERLDHQIDIMQETLDFEKENGLLWNQVYTVLDGSAEEIAQYIQENTSEYWGKSPTELAQTMRENLFTIDKFKELQVIGGMEAMIAMYNDQKDEEAAEDEKKNKEAEEAAAAAAGADSSVNTGNSNTGGTNERWKATYTGKEHSGYGIGSTAAQAKANATALAKKKNPSGSYQVNKPYKLATGGLVKQPTYALIGEEGEEGILNAAQTEYLRKNLMGRHPDSFVTAVDDFFATLEADKRAMMALTSTNNANDYASVNIEHASVNLQIDKLANDYDARRAANTIMQEMLHIASKSQSNNSVGR